MFRFLLEVLTDGTPCAVGFCEKGRCEKSVQDPVQRFWDVIEEVNARTFVKFMKDNIVGFVAIFTALAWIPICVAIAKYDQKIKQQVKKLINDQRERRSLLPTPHITLTQAGAATPSSAIAPRIRASTSSDRSGVTIGSARGLLDKKTRVRTTFGTRMHRNPTNRETFIVRAAPRTMRPSNGSASSMNNVAPPQAALTFNQEQINQQRNLLINQNLPIVQQTIAEAREARSDTSDEEGGFLTQQQQQQQQQIHIEPRVSQSSGI